MTHWLPYIGFWSIAVFFAAAFAFYIYAALPLFRPSRKPWAARPAGLVGGPAERPRALVSVAEVA